MKTTERTVHFYDLVLRSSSAAVEKPQVAELSQLLQAMETASPKGRLVVKNSNVMVEIADWDYHSASDSLRILINKADRTASDVAFKSFNTRTTRKGNKTTDEGIDFSCHIIVKPRPGVPKALALITMGAGVSAGTLESVLNLLAREIRTTPKHKRLFNFAHPSGALDAKGKPETYSVRYRFDALVHKSAALEQALSDGELMEMDLIGDEQEAFDAGGNLQIERKHISIKPRNAAVVTAANIKNAVRRYIKSDRNIGVDRLRVVYKKPSGDIERATLGVNDLDALFTRKEKIHFSTPVEQQQTSLSPDVIDAMSKFL